MKILLKILVFFLLVVFGWSNIVTNAYASKKLVQVDLTSQTLKAYEDGHLIFNFPVSTGIQMTPTPNGGFWPWIKLKYDRMTGGSGTRAYDLPNVPYVVYFYNENYPKSAGYALHGTYWHNNFGTPMSHGCINLKTEDMAQLFPWIDLPSATQKGTVIIVGGQTPPS